MGVSVLKLGRLLIIAVALIIIIIMVAKHVPQCLPVWHLSLLSMLQTFVQPLLLPLAKKCHYLKLLSRPKMASDLVVRNLKMTSSVPFFVKKTRPQGIIVRPPLAMMKPLGITVWQPLATRCLYIVLWHGLIASLTYLRWEIDFSFVEMSQMWLTMRTTIYYSNLVKVTPESTSIPPLPTSGHPVDVQDTYPEYIHHYQSAKFKDIKVYATLQDAQEELMHHIKTHSFLLDCLMMFTNGRIDGSN
jgi:hypothetical protein